jgi:hypothetical protein
MWQRQDDGVQYNWYRASGTFDATHNPESTDVCGSLALGGYDDWRLPARQELFGIVDYGVSGAEPRIRADAFPDTKPSSYWTAIPPIQSGPEAGRAQAVRFGFGDGGRTNVDSYVRCVRGEREPPALSDNGDGTVTDHRTGLVWQQRTQGVPPGQLWDEALSLCEQLVLGGRADWRLPNIKELQSLMRETNEMPAIDPRFFPDARTLVPAYWSSTTFPTSPIYAMMADVGAGMLFNWDKGGQGLPLLTRCVRSGPQLLRASAGALDGWILESAENSGKGGTTDATSATIRIGDDAADRQYRGILSFDTSVLPDDAVIVSATLKLKSAGQVGTRFAALRASAILGSFSGARALSPADFDADATVENATESIFPRSGWFSTRVFENAVNRTGLTQFRLRLGKDDNDNLQADYLLIFSGNAPAASRPALEIQYFVP